MRLVRVGLPLAIMLGLVASTSAFLQRVRPTHVLVPAHKYQAAVCRSRVPRMARNMRVMSATVEADMDDVAVTQAPPEETEASAPDIPVEGGEMVDVTADATEPDDLDEILGEDDSAEPAVQIPMDTIIIGEEYEGVVNNVVSYGAFVDIGTEVNGLVHISQLADEFVANCDDFVKEGDTVRVRVINLDVEARKLVLSMRQKNRNPATSQGDVSKYQAMIEEDPSQFMDATVENIVSYGAFFTLEDGCSGFVHISQMSPPGEHVNEVSDVLSIGQTVPVRIREIDEKLGRINLSLLPISADDISRMTPREKDVSHLTGVDPNEFRKGVVSAVADYGLFVNVEGVDGLLHVSKMSVDRSITSGNIREKFQEGQEVEVRILDANPETNKMSLSMLLDNERLGTQGNRRKKLLASVAGPKGRTEPPSSPTPSPKPLEYNIEDYATFLDIPPTEWIDGKVVSMVEYGAFVRLPQGVDGMVHISQMGSQGQRVASVYEELQMGQEVKVRILEVDTVRQKLRLTMRDPEFDDAPSGETGGGERGPRRKTNSVEAYLNIPPDEWISGTVASITNFGAFIAVDADTDGLCHISQIADEHVANVDDFLEVGQNVQVRVIEVDVDNCRLGLSMREPRAASPRGGGGRGAKKDVSFLLGRDPEEFISGQVVSIVPYGAFVNIEGDVDGLVHISELAVGRVDTVEDVVQVGQEVQVRITEVNPDNNTVNLSMVPADQVQRRRGGRGSGGMDDYGGNGFGGSREGGRKSRGGRRDSGSSDNSASFEREDFGGRGSGSAPTNSDDGADWQYFLNDYFEEKDNRSEAQE